MSDFPPRGPSEAEPSRRLQDGPLPLYHQLEQDLLARIDGGEFQPGAPLPTEERICEQYGVSRITVRRALESLFAHGLIIRRRGVGSFVAERGRSVRSVHLSGSLDDFLTTAGALEVEVLSLGSLEPPADVREALELSAEDREVMRLELTSSLDGAPVIYSEIYFPVQAGIRRADITPGLPVIRIVERKLNLHITLARQLIESQLAGPEAGRRLGLAPETPVLRIRRVYYTAGGRPVEVAILKHHPDRYQYEIELRSRSGRF